MNKLKALWDKLAKENSMYYINTDKGKRITEEQFRESGRKDYLKYIIEDRFIVGRFTLSEVTILEIGVGTGRIAEFMAEDFHHVIGIDISGEMIKQGKKRLGLKDTTGEINEGGFVEGIELIETDGRTIPLPANCIDIAFSYLVFQHIKDRKMVEKNFEEVYRVLKPKGMFKVRIRSDKVNLNKWWGGVEYTEQSIGKLIKRIGFELLKTEPVGNYGFWLWLEK